MLIILPAMSLGSRDKIIKHHINARIVSTDTLLIGEKVRLGSSCIEILRFLS